MVEVVKASIVRILLAHKGEITLDKIVEEFRKSSGELLTGDSYGFKSIEDLLESFKDVMKITGGEGKRKALQLTGDDTTAYIQQLLTNQRNRRDKSKQISTHLRPSKIHSPDQDSQGSTSKLPSNPPIPRMDQSGSGRGAGRGRGQILLQALANAQSTGRPGQDILRETTVSDEEIKTWIIKTLCSKPNGFLARYIPNQFECEFKTKAPEDLMTRIKSFEDAIDVESGPVCDIIYLKKAITQTVNKEPAEKPQIKSNDNVKGENINETYTRRSIDQWQMPEEGSIVDVHVLYANTPDDFCICPYALHNKLTSLMRDLNAYFKQNEQIAAPAESVIPGCVFAVKFTGHWYRVRVESTPNSENKILVNLADYALKVPVEAGKLMILPDHFKTLPFCGIKAQLHDVLPNNPLKGWSETALEEFKKIVEFRDLVCVVLERGGDNPVGVRLVDTSQEDDVIVDEILEDLGLICRVQFE